VTIILLVISLSVRQFLQHQF